MLHFKEHYNATERYSVLGAQSPIDTFNYMDPWNVDILGPAGTLRNQIVKTIKEKEIIALGYNSDELKHSYQE